MGKLSVKTMLVSCVLAVTCGGCIWPGLIAARGNAHVTTAQSATAVSEQVTSVALPRLVVVQYWRNKGVNETPPSFDLVKAFATDAWEFPVKYSLRLYTVVWTPALATQHFAPEAGIVVFATGNWPSYCLPPDGRIFCDKPPKNIPLAFDVTLKPAGGTPPGKSPTAKLSVEEFPPLIYKLCSLDWVLTFGRGITDTDRLMVYSQLRKQAAAWQRLQQDGQIEADPEKLREAIEALGKRIAKLERKTVAG